MKNYLDDILFVLGSALITTGAYLLFPVAALFVAGFFCILGGFLFGLSQREVRRDPI